MALILSAGDFKTKVVIKKPTDVKGNQGDVAKTFAPFLTTWAAVKTISQQRIAELNNPALLDTVFFYIRFAEDRKEIGVDWLIEMNGINHHIFSKPTLRESGLKVIEITAKAKHA